MFAFVHPFPLQLETFFEVEAQGADPVSLTFHSVLRKIYTESSIGASGQISVHLVTRFQRRICLRNQPIRNNNCLWRTCLLTNRAEMSNLYKRPSIDASYEVSIHLHKRFQRRSFLRNQPIIKKNCLWRPCLLTDRYEMKHRYRGHAIYAFYQVSVHLAMQFERRIFF